MKEKLRGFLPVILFFVVLNSIFIAGRSMLEDRGVDQEVLLLGNGLIFLITLVSFHKGDYTIPIPMYLCAR